VESGGVALVAFRNATRAASNRSCADWISITPASERVSPVPLSKAVSCDFAARNAVTAGKDVVVEIGIFAEHGKPSPKGALTMHELLLCSCASVAKGPG
jgi:hypothetical protein